MGFSTLDLNFLYTGIDVRTVSNKLECCRYLEED